MGAPILKVESLTYTTPTQRPLASNVNFQLSPSELLVIEGANGSGKSTLLRILIGQHAHYSGTISHQLKKDKIAYIPQLQNPDFHLPLSLLDVLRVSIPHVNESDIEKWGLLEKKHLDLSWNTASGGERKRTLLTRALIQNCSLLILDEPFNHLDRESKQIICQGLETYLKGPEERAVILVSHEADALFTSANLKKLMIGSAGA